MVDVSGLYVTPGLIDIHVHVGHGGAPLEWFTPEARAHTRPYGIPADMALQAGSDGLPMLIGLDPQYPLAQSPDLIQPGWKLNVG